MEAFDIRYTVFVLEERKADDAELFFVFEGRPVLIGFIGIRGRPLPRWDLTAGLGEAVAAGCYVVVEAGEPEV